MIVDIPCWGLLYVGEVVENDRFFDDAISAVFGNLVEEELFLGDAISAVFGNVVKDELFFDDRIPTVAPIIIAINTIIPITPSPSNILF